MFPRGARALPRLLGVDTPVVLVAATGATWRRSGLEADVLSRALPAVGMVGRHTSPSWRATFSTICNEEQSSRKPVSVIDVMLAVKTFGEVEGRYNKATFLDARRRIACAWADQLLAGSPSAFAVAGLVEPIDNVIQLREAA